MHMLTENGENATTCPVAICSSMTTVIIATTCVFRSVQPVDSQFFYTMQIIWCTVCSAYTYMPSTCSSDCLPFLGVLLHVCLCRPVIPWP